MGSQGPPKLSPESPLVTNDTSSNVAVNQQQAKDTRAASVDGRDIYPSRVFTKDLSLETSLTIGGGVTLTDDCVQANHLATNSVTTDALNCTNVTATDLSLSGNLSSFGVANLGTITGGSLSIAGGGVTVSNGATGISIGSNSITCIYGGGATVTIDGATGVITASKFALTADAGSSVNLTLGTHVLATSITVGAGTLGSIQTDATAGAAKITSFAQDAIPTSLKAGDFWCDTNDGNKLYRAAAAGANEIKAGEWVAVQDTAYTSKNVTFAQASIPTSLAAGDVWIDTDDGNKMYRAAAAGADQITAGEWVAVLDALTEGNGIVTNTSNQITRINTTSGIVISTTTADTGARTQITSDGVKVYNTAGTLVCTLYGASGLRVNNATAPAGETERLSLAYEGTEYGYIYATTNTLYLEATGTAPAITLTATTVTVNANIEMFSGKAIQGVHKAYDGSYKANTSFSFDDNAGDTHTVTFEDGLIVSWTKA